MLEALDLEIEIAKAKAKAKKKKNTAIDERISNDLTVDQTGKSFISKFPEQTVVDRALATAVGSGEALLTLGSGAVAEPTAGLLGIGELVSSIIAGDDDPLNDANERIEAISDALTFQPRTEEGKQILGTVAIPLQKFDEITTEGGHAVGEITRPVVGDTAANILATIAKTGAIMSPSVVGGGLSAKPNPVTVAKDVAKVKGSAKDLGIDLNSKITDQFNQLSETGKKLANNAEMVGKNVENIVPSVKAAKTIADEKVTALYKKARSKEAFVDINIASELKGMVDGATKSYIREELHPRTLKLLDDIDQMVILSEKLPEGSHVSLNKIYEFRQKINKNTPPKNDRPSNAVNGIIKGQLDKLLKNKFDTDMIKGDPSAIAAWRKADKAKFDFEKTFNETDLIKRFTKNEVTPEEVSAWIFGSADAGFKVTSGKAIKQIKRALGEDSPEITALRQEAIFKVISPLLEEKPNMFGFIDNYNKMVRKNPTLVKELFPDSEKALAEMARFAKAQTQTLKPGVLKSFESFGFPETLSRILVGHQIAKAQVRVTLFGKLIGALKAVTTKSEKRRLMAEMLGYDHKAPMFKPRVVTNTAAITTGAEQPIDNRVVDDLIN